VPSFERRYVLGNILLSSQIEKLELVMRILIVEDERPTAEDIQLLVKIILKKEISSIHIETTLTNALVYLREKPIDVLLLDLNLHERDGFQILKEFSGKSFHTIVISADTDQGKNILQYDKLDFIPKPYNAQRLQAAFDRIKSSHSAESHRIK
jgi:two-component system response regulator LytT